LALTPAAAVNASKHEVDEIEVRLQYETRANVALVAGVAAGSIYAGPLPARMAVEVFRVFANSSVACQ
jgi:hypothetical protein